MPRINVTGGYTPGAIGAIVSLHTKYYAMSLDRGLEYEARIATEKTTVGSCLWLTKMMTSPSD
jgi:hypothetical protein